jgi:Tfp pilus assembly protein PilF
MHLHHRDGPYARARRGPSAPAGALRKLLWVATAATLLALAGCAQGPLLQALAVLPDEHPYPIGTEAAEAAAEAAQVFTMSQAMRDYVERMLRNPATRGERRQALIDALYLKSELRLMYDAGVTRTAAQAFDARAGNCLSLVLMTAAFAKHLDLPVTYQQVRVEDEFNRAGGLYFVSGHINVLLGRQGTTTKTHQPDWLAIDFLPQEDLRGQEVVPVEERTVVAMFLNNRAAEALARGELARAYWWARAALNHDAQYAVAANTLGVIYQRAGRSQAAERALRYVTAREPRNASAWANLTRLLRSQGRLEEANAAAERLAALEPFPPFHHLERGQQALQEGHAAQARDLMLRELRLQPLQHEVHFWLAQAYAALGQPKAAARHLSLAAEYSPTRNARELYSAKLERLRASTAQ